MRIAFRLDPLPDVLFDHTLMSTDAAGRMQEARLRWEGFLAALWTWSDRASFAVRFLGGVRPGAVDVLLVAQAFQPADHDPLRDDLVALTAVHRLPRRRFDAAIFPGGADSLRPAESGAVVEVGQLWTTGLWQGASVEELGVVAARHPEVPADLFRTTTVTAPWRGALGSFLLPFEILARATVRAAVTVLLVPTRLTPLEETWLRGMASLARARSQQDRQLAGGGLRREHDPSAEHASRSYMDALNRLRQPFLVAAYCESAAGLPMARRLAGALDATTREPASGGDGPSATGTTAEVVFDAAGSASSGRWSAACGMSFDASGRAGYPAPLWRFRYLADARGAATLFRLPTPVRGGVPGVAVRRAAPQSHPGPRVVGVPAGHLDLGELEQGGRATVPVDQVCRHVLMVGMNGSGKTVTVQHLLTQLWSVHRTPFMVLETAKCEYRSFLDHPGFQGDDAPWIFTPGDESCAPFRFNPFELGAGVRLERHVGRLRAAFDAALPPVGPISSLIEEALWRIYGDRGWRPDDRGDVAESREFPTMTDLHDAVAKVIVERGYVGEVRATLEAALTGRLKPFTRMLPGGKGKMFDCARTAPTLERLLARPVILELDGLNRDEKALVVMLLLVAMREAREADLARQPADSAVRRLRHVVVIEEAHNVLERTASNGRAEGSGSDVRFGAAEAAATALCESRALGQGIVVVDQSPTKLARDVLSNTNLQIVHELRDPADREAVASAMVLDQDQRDFLAVLEPGQAAVFHTGRQTAAFVRVPRGPDLPLPSDERVRAHMASVVTPAAQTCAYCRMACTHARTAAALLDDVAVRANLAAAAGRIAGVDADPAESMSVRWGGFISAARRAMRAVGVDESPEAAWHCYLNLHAERVFGAREVRFDRIKFDAAWREADRPAATAAGPTTGEAS